MLFEVSGVYRFLYFGEGRWRREEGDWNGYGGNALDVLGRVSERGVHPDAKGNGMKEGGLGDRGALGIASRGSKITGRKGMCRI